MKNNNIILIGLMGAGKTTIGKLLAEKLNYKFIDTDELIEKHAGIKIAEIFKQQGESSFRKLETQTIEKLSNEENSVISTGGGIVKNIENINILKQLGTLFYLYAPAEELYNRLKNSTTNRPLLHTESPLNTLKKLLNERENNYSLSDYKIETKNKEINEIINEIIEKM